MLLSMMGEKKSLSQAFLKICFIIILFNKGWLHNVVPALSSHWCLTGEVTGTPAKYQPDGERIVPLKMSLIFSMLSPMWRGQFTLVTPQIKALYCIVLRQLLFLEVKNKEILLFCGI